MIKYMEMKTGAKNGEIRKRIIIRAEKF